MLLTPRNPFLFRTVLRKSAAFATFPALLVCAAFAPPAEEPVPADQAALDGVIRPHLDKYCAPCHKGKDSAGGVDVTAFKTVQDLQKDQQTWRRVMVQIRDRSMPPPGSTRPSSLERETLTRWLSETLNRVDDSLLPKNPGRVIPRRLSRLEYNNTVRDLFGITIRPADKFPADGSGGGGFDNNADTLFLQPVLMERYLEAASEVVHAAAPDRLFLTRPGKGTAPREAARQTLARHAEKAWRRPVDAVEVNGLLALHDGATKRGETWQEAVRFAMKAVLVSPNFLYRTESEPADNAENKDNRDAYPVNDYALASRLSYFLWSSTPDDTLLRLAAEKKLSNPAVLEAQARRMLADPKARAFTENFVGQWLRARELYTTAQPDRGRFPQYTTTLRDAMYQETVLFFDSVVRRNESLLTLLDANYTFVNSELARHYGLPDPGGNQMRRVALSDARRGGVLTQASVLTVTSYPRRTSPVVRGKWVLDEVLGTPAPPPPSVVATLSQDDKTNKEGLTFRQRLEKHREKPECAGCHSRMDPLGFGLENYDVIGKWRETIGDAPVDAKGLLANGDTFVGPAALKKHLLTRREDFIRNLTERMLSYSLGRGLEPYDLLTVRNVSSAVQKNSYRAETLVLEIVKSYPFRYRKRS